MGEISEEILEKNAEPESNADRNWTTIAAGGALITGALLLLAGKRKVGTVVAVGGAALALVDQQEVVKQWWQQLPGYLTEAQRIANSVEGAVEEVAARRESLHKILGR